MSVGTALKLLLGIPMVLVPALVVVGGVLTLWQAYRLYGRDPDLVAEAVDGDRVEIEGAARPVDGETDESPFGGRESLVVSYEVRQSVPDQGTGTDSEVIDSGTVGVPFELAAADGSVLVRADEGPTYELTDDAESITVDTGSQIPERIRRFVEDSDAVGSQYTSVDLGITEVDVGPARNYEEQRLEPGETVFVTGIARSPTDEETDLLPGAAAVVGPPPEPTGGARGRRHRHCDGPRRG